MPRMQDFPGLETDYPNLALVPAAAEMTISVPSSGSFRDYNITIQQIGAIIGDLGSGEGITSVQADPAPRLGGNLTVGTYWVGGASPSDLNSLHSFMASVTVNEIRHLAGVTSLIQGQLDGKAPTVHTQAAATISDSTTVGRAVLTAADAAAARTALGISGAVGITDIIQDTTPQLGGNLDVNGFSVGGASPGTLTKMQNITASSAELNYTTGVTSAIQTQLDGKAPTSHTHTASQISDSTAAGRALLTAATVEAQQLALGITSGSDVTSQFQAAASDPTNGPLIAAAIAAAFDLAPVGAASTALGNAILRPLRVASDATVLTSDDEVAFGTALVDAGITLGSASGPGSIALAEDTDNGTNKAVVVAPASLASDVTLTAPTSSGTLARVAAATGVPASSDVTDVAPTALTDAATVAVDLALNRNFTLTIGGNRTLGNPTNQSAGRSGAIIITQDGTGSRTLAYGNNWKFPGGTPTLSTTADAVDVLTYVVAASGTIYANLLKAFA